jgi:hypothetical protein
MDHSKQVADDHWPHLEKRFKMIKWPHGGNPNRSGYSSHRREPTAIGGSRQMEGLRGGLQQNP